MDEGFQYMVKPLAYDRSLRVEGSDAVERVYGTPGGDGATPGTGELLNVSTLFPSRSEGDSGEGSVILLELDDAARESVTLTASYETPAGEQRSVTREVDFENRSAPYYESTGVRKAVALTRYANLMQNWAAFERAVSAGEDGTVPGEGIERQADLGRWEQQSVPLNVSGPYGDRIERFERYFWAEKRVLGADRLSRDLEVLTTLTGNESTAPAMTMTTDTAADSNTTTPENASGGNATTTRADG
jgi:Ca-activated chloride channel family protein